MAESSLRSVKEDRQDKERSGQGIGPSASGKLQPGPSASGPLAASPKGQPAPPPTGPSDKPAQAAPQDHNARMRLLAHQRLDQLFDEAERAKFWGVVGIEITWEGGTVRLIHRRLEGRDKA